MEERKSLFDVLDPKQSFMFGIVGGVLVLCTIGFFIMLAGGGSTKTTGRTVRTGDTAPAAAAVAPTPSAPTQVTVPEVTDEDHIRGNVDAEITIVEYSDIECPFCSRFHDTMNQVIDVYGDDVRWVYRHFPLESIHQNARPAAIAAECAAEQGEFWSYLDLSIERQRELSGNGLATIATDIGLNVSKFTECVDSNKYDALVSQDARDAQAAGGRGTPYSVLIGPEGETVVISGAQPFTNVEAEINKFLN